MSNLANYLSSARLEEFLARVPALRIGVIGDICLDAYWTVDMTRARLSRETPHFARPVVSEAYAPGAGANVAQNLAAAGIAQAPVFALVGADIWGEQLKTELTRRKIDTRGVVSVPGRRTTAYIKPLLTGYHAQQEDARLDFENSLPLDPAAEDQLLDRLEQALPNLDALIVADQLERYGAVSARVCARLNELAAARTNTLFLADSRTRITAFRNMVLKPNDIEAGAAYPGKSLSGAAHALSELAGARPVYITLGENGVLACSPAGQEILSAAPVQPPLDIVGAGDAFLAWLAAGLASGANPLEAGALANLAAAVTVEKLNQTGSASPDEIRRRYAQCIA